MLLSSGLDTEVLEHHLRECSVDVPPGGPVTHAPMYEKAPPAHGGDARGHVLEHLRVT